MLYLCGIIWVYLQRYWFSIGKKYALCQVLVIFVHVSLEKGRIIDSNEFNNSIMIYATNFYAEVTNK
jgi:hypothetical protein